AAVEERQRLARELHDSVSQALYGISLGAQTARTLLERDPAAMAAPLDYVIELAQVGMAEMRSLIFELRPESLEAEGLVAALEKQAAAIRARQRLTVDLTLSPEPDWLSLDGKEALYRIAQESLHNTIKHAQASWIGKRLTSGADSLVLEIVDDGKGSTAATRSRVTWG
ncbi:MAG: sensor histidine kinase, partial [Thermomicrobiales bacterium]